MLGWLSKHLFFRLWEYKDGSSRLAFLRELNQSQWLPEDVLRKRQWERLTEIVRYAHQNCAYYQHSIDSRKLDEYLESPDAFAGFPMLTKADVRHAAPELISAEFSREKLLSTKTGGSTGKALVLYFDEKCQEMRNAAAMRSDGWAGWDMGCVTAAVWGNPPRMNTMKKKFRNLLHDRTFYLDTMDINPDSLKKFVEQWHIRKPSVLFGHAHSLYILAKYVQDNDIGDLRPRGIVATSMMLVASERKVIESAFGCRVTNRYGCEEVGLIACECEHHVGMHLNLDHVYVEFIKEDGSVAHPGEAGQIVVTDLCNLGMPLIRYQVGDIGVPDNRACVCGRGLPLMQELSGRLADFLKRPDGSLVAGVSLIERTLTAIPGIEQMQIVQEAMDRLDVNLVSAPEFSEDERQELVDELGSVFGIEVHIELHFMDAIPQERNGKYRFAICRV